MRPSTHTYVWRMLSPNDTDSMLSIKLFVRAGRKCDGYIVLPQTGQGGGKEDRISVKALYAYTVYTYDRHGLDSK